MQDRCLGVVRDGTERMKGFLTILIFYASSAFAISSDALFGTAAMISASAPMVMAGFQASADQAMARINGQTSIAVSQIQADTAKYLADLQLQTVFSQLATTFGMNWFNQKSETDRLIAKLGAAAEARHDNTSLAREKMGMEWALNKELIAVSKRQADTNSQLGRLALAAKLVQAGLSPWASLATTANITVTRVLSSRSRKMPLRVGAVKAVTTSPANSRSLTGIWKRRPDNSPASTHR